MLPGLLESGEENGREKFHPFLLPSRGTVRSSTLNSLPMEFETGEVVVLSTVVHRV